MWFETPNLSEIRWLLCKSFRIRKQQKQQFFYSHKNPYISNVSQQCRWSYFESELAVRKLISVFAPVMSDLKITTSYVISED